MSIVEGPRVTLSTAKMCHVILNVVKMCYVTLSAAKSPYCDNTQRSFASLRCSYVVNRQFSKASRASFSPQETRPSMARSAISAL